jgi:hypothetical protein
MAAGSVPAFYPASHFCRSNFAERPVAALTVLAWSRERDAGIGNERVGATGARAQQIDVALEPADAAG